jgi:hypothetical protein
VVVDADADAAAECLEKCNSDSTCKFWDISSANACILRSNEGIGLIESIGRSYGQKNCVISKYILKW